MFGILKGARMLILYNFDFCHRGVGRIYVQKAAKVGDIVSILNERKGLPANTPLKLFEVGKDYGYFFAFLNSGIS